MSWVLFRRLLVRIASDLRSVATGPSRRWGWPAGPGSQASTGGDDDAVAGCDCWDPGEEEATCPGPRRDLVAVGSILLPPDVAAAAVAGSPPPPPPAAAAQISC